MESLKTISATQVLQHDLAREHNFSKHVLEQLDIYWDGSNFEE